MANLSWTQVAVVALLIAATVGTLLGGSALGLSAEQISMALGGEGVIATIVAWLLRSPLTKGDA